VQRIVVIGGGLTGAAFVLHLLRDHDPVVRITVVEPRPVLGAGLAYSTGDPVHRVNVAAGRMSLFDEQPGHFDDWLRAHFMPQDDPEGIAPAGLFPRRALYGQYVDETLRAALGGARATLGHRRERAVAVGVREARFEVWLEGGGSLQADLLVLAASHTSPDLPGVLRPLAADERLVADPWAPEALAGIEPDGAVMVVGTGLTGCDVIASLCRRGHRGPILAVSRRGLLPRTRTALPVTSFGRFDEAPERTALGLLRRVRAAVAEVRQLGRPWEDVVAALRSQARVVWGALPDEERRRLLRHARPFWDAHRFQSAPQIDTILAEASTRGQLRLMAATLRAVSAEPGGLRVALHPRGAAAGREVEERVAAIVNCTGPGHRSVVEQHPVLASLAEQDALQADGCRLGIAVDASSRVIDAAGRPWPNLFVVGPLARGTHGELMGLPQVSAQPREVAAEVARLISRNPVAEVRIPGGVEGPSPSRPAAPSP